MIKKKHARSLLGVINLLTIGSLPLVAQVSYAAADQKIEKLNVASLKSIESTWLKVPPACKARGFNASPISLEHKTITSRVQNIYSSFGV